MPGVFTDWREMVASDLDAVLILTSGSHAPIAIEAARVGAPRLYRKADVLFDSRGRAR